MHVLKARTHWTNLPVEISTLRPIKVEDGFTMYRVATDLRVVIDRLEEYELHFEDEFRAEIDFARPFFDEEDEDAAAWMKMLKDVDLKWRDADATTREKREAAKLSKKKAKQLSRQVMLKPYFIRNTLHICGRSRRATVC